ncbi:MAG: hypothetical protein ACRETU_14035 [Steroidobacterales bacterium]
MALFLLTLAGCGRQPAEPREQTPQEYAAARERDINYAGPTWAQRLAAMPGDDDIDRAIALAKSLPDYDFGAVDFLGNELVAKRDPRIVAALMDTVSNAAFPARNRAAEALAKANVHEARTVILWQLGKSPNFAGDLVAALGQLGDESTVRQLSDLASNTDNELVRSNANRAKHFIAVRMAKAQ